MKNTETKSDSQADDEAYENAPLQFAADRMSELVRAAEADPNSQVTVHVNTLNKLYLAYIGVLEVYKAQTAAGTLIGARRYLCSVDLRDAIAPILEEHRRIQAEADVDREIELMKAEAATYSSKEAAPKH